MDMRSILPAIEHIDRFLPKRVLRFPDRGILKITEDQHIEPRGCMSGVATACTVEQLPDVAFDGPNPGDGGPAREQECVSRDPIDAAAATGCIPHRDLTPL